MKMKFSYFYLLLVFVVASCSKGGSNEDGSAKIRCTIDGVDKVFNTAATAIRYDEAGNYSVQIIGFEGSQTSNHISLSLVGNQAIRATDYTEDGGDTDDTRIGMIAYTQKQGDATYLSDDSDTNPARITITSISQTSVQGTFTGEIFLVDSNDDSPAARMVTNGTFNVEF